MSSIRLLPYQPGHLDVMDMNLADRSREQMEEAVRCRASDPDSHLATLLVGNDVISIVGLKVLHEGVAEVNAITSPLVSRLPLAFTRLCKGLIASYMKDLGLHRVQFYVRFDNEMGRRWAVVLGFQEEGYLRNFSQDRAGYFIFARFA